MLKSYLAEYYVSDEELKKRICNAIKVLSVISPKSFSLLVLRFVKPEMNSQIFLSNLIGTVPLIKELSKGFQNSTFSEKLRAIAMRLDGLLYTQMCRTLLTKLTYI